jgi:hypothetical protein
MTKHHQSSAVRTVRTLGALALLTLGGSMFLPSGAKAQDPYDASLEKRVEALEKELNIMEGDSKGKNVETTNVPTFLTAAGTNVQQLTISGDLRFRYNYDNQNLQYPSSGTENDNLERSRYLFRLRLNLNYTLSDNFFVGLGVSTLSQTDSQNQPITEGFDDYGIYLHQFVVGWKATDWGTVVIGKLFAPFYDNEDALVDFGDINPTGLTEELNFTISPQLNIAMNFGQYIFYDNPESGYSVTPYTLTATSTSGGKTTTTTVVDNVYSTNPASTIPQDRKEDAIFSYNDIVATYKPTNAVTITAAPAFYTYLLHGSVGVSGNAVGPSGRSSPNDVNTANPLSPTQGALLNGAAFNSDEATDDLYVAMFNGDVKFPVGPFKGKFYWDFAYNITGSERSHHIYDVQEGDFTDSTTWLAGIQLGELKRKGDWYVSADFRQEGIASLDPNLNDPNFALSQLNQQGFRINVGYNIMAWMKVEAFYYGSWNLHENIHNVVTGSQGLSGTSGSSIYQTNAAQNFIVQLNTSF